MSAATSAGGSAAPAPLGSAGSVSARSAAAAGMFDVAIIGGGMVGASLALGLKGCGLSIVLVEGTAPDSGAQPSFDDRTTALGNASRRIFEALDVWPAIAPQAAAIRTIHVSDAGRFGFARLRAQEQGIDAFGFVVSNRVIGTALWTRLRDDSSVSVRVPARAESVSITPECVHLQLALGSAEREALTARLVVAADGAHSLVRTAAGIEAEVEDYDQVAIATNAITEPRQDGTAYERFTRAGPLAVLPLHDGSHGIVWTARPDRAAELLALGDEAFLHALQNAFGWRAGRFVRVGRRVSYPLKLSRARATTASRAVLIGNAAQALHPVAGQGFNLGLRDAAMLAEVIANCGGDVGSPETLSRFSRWRAADRTGVVRFTDGLVKLFGDPRRSVGAARDLGLLLFDLAPPAKSALARLSAGFGGRSPRLARGLGVRGPTP